MADEVSLTYHDVTVGDHDHRVTDWEAGLPDAADLPPLSQILISPELASAFSISPEPHRSLIDVDRASRDTISSLRGQSQLNMINKPINMNKLNDLRCGFDDRDEEMVLDGDGENSPERKFRRVDGGGDGGDGGGSGGGGEEAESPRMNNNNNNNNNNNKRVRLVWTPQLHKRFVEVVAHLGVKNAVPKTIMQLMNVEGLTRENVASHLQKYRLYLKRMQGGLGEGTSCSDNLFASTPVPKSLRESDGPVNMPYPQQMVPMPYPMPQIVPSGSGGGGGGYQHGFEYHSHPYNMMMQPKEWSGNNVGSVLPYQHSMTQNHK